MALKDYYSILGIATDAPLTIIKQAYYALARRHHPDLNNNDPEAIIRFLEIKEAYEILSDPLKKSNYLQQRWLHKAGGKKLVKEPVTPVYILKELFLLEKKVLTTDPERLPPKRLLHSIYTILTDENLAKLKDNNDPMLNSQVVYSALRCSDSLPPVFLQQLLAQLETLQQENNSQEAMTVALTQRKKKMLWEKYRAWVMIIFTLLICILIWLANRSW